MQVITAQLIATKELLSDLMHERRIDAPTAAAHIADANTPGASGIVLELRAEPQPARAFKIELNGILSVELHSYG